MALETTNNIEISDKEFAKQCIDQLNQNQELLAKLYNQKKTYIRLKDKTKLQSNGLNGYEIIEVTITKHEDPYTAKEDLYTAKVQLRAISQHYSAAYRGEMVNANTHIYTFPDDIDTIPGSQKIIKALKNMESILTQEAKWNILGTVSAKILKLLS